MRKHTIVRVRVDDQTLNKIYEKCKEENTDVSKLIRNAINQYIGLEDFKALMSFYMYKFSVGLSRVEAGLKFLYNWILYSNDPKKMEEIIKEVKEWLKEIEKHESLINQVLESPRYKEVMKRVLEMEKA